MIIKNNDSQKDKDFVEHLGCPKSFPSIWIPK